MYFLLGLLQQIFRMMCTVQQMVLQEMLLLGEVHNFILGWQLKE